LTEKRIVIVGATSRLAELCARLWVARGAVELVLVGRNLSKLEAIASDLGVRSPQSSISSQVVDFTNPLEIQVLTDEICTKQGVPDIVLIAHGSLPDQQSCQTDLEQVAEALNINGLSPALFAEAFANKMQKVGKGTIAIIGSVAGDRGRKSNYVYGAAKGLLNRYAQGMQHRFAGTGVSIVLIKPGPTDTPMTADLKSTGAKLASAEEVAELIVEGVEQGKPEVYAPKKWALIMTVIRHLPKFVFNKMNI
jgi:decaprenylphospho-beta-D-erythro-pentofuranosid-2-ulose 2-reductase